MTNPPNWDSLDIDLADALDGLYAYDGGAVDSGIHDETLRRRAYDQIKAMAPDNRCAWICEFVISHCLSPEAQASGYGPEDALDFLEWLRDQVPSAVIYVYGERTRS